MGKERWHLRVVPADQPVHTLLCDLLSGSFFFSDLSEATPTSLPLAVKRQAVNHSHPAGTGTSCQPVHLHEG